MYMTTEEQKLYCERIFKKYNDPDDGWKYESIFLKASSRYPIVMKNIINQYEIQTGEQ